MTTRTRTSIALACGLLAGLAPAALAGPAVVFRGTVTRVTDGDTIHASVRGFDIVVRLLGVDTREKWPPRGPQCGGREASARMAQLLPLGSAVTLASDPTQSLRDRYGRYLFYVGRGSAAPGPTGSVNYRLLQEGMAEAYVFDRQHPFRYADLYLEAMRRARAARLGIWRLCGLRTVRS